MRTTYRVLGYLIAVLVAVQAAAVAFAMFGMIAYVEGGGTIDAASQETTSFTGDVGFMIHGMGGEIAIPLAAVVLLIVSFFAHVPKGVMWAGIVVGTVVVQVALGLFAFGIPGLGILHGLGALALFVAALIAARRATAPAVDGEPGAPAEAPREQPTQPA